jgi:hypothetical protein
LWYKNSIKKNEQGRQKMAKNNRYISNIDLQTEIRRGLKPFVEKLLTAFGQTHPRAASIVETLMTARSDWNKQVDIRQYDIDAILKDPSKRNGLRDYLTRNHIEIFEHAARSSNQEYLIPEQHIAGLTETFYDAASIKQEARKKIPLPVRIMLGKKNLETYIDALTAAFVTHRPDFLRNASSACPDKTCLTKNRDFKPLTL